MNKKILTLIAMVAISIFSFTSVVAKDKSENEDKKEDRKERKKADKGCKKECGIALNKCNHETGKIDDAKKDERKASHEKCQKTFTDCKAACK
ncbi:MAG TPA: hypothetical protein PLX69_18050 [Leptospiraceae bacterium]|nr:hypothetical protein [Leptospiraceae bacterium]HRG76468.1 hypothetical protein [Leptospiraceae bacterium]